MISLISATVDFLLGVYSYFLGTTFVTNLIEVGFLFLTDGVAEVQL